MVERHRVDVDAQPLRGDPRRAGCHRDQLRTDVNTRLDDFNRQMEALRKDIIDAVQIPRIGPSLGGVESLIEQPLVMSYYECTPEDRCRFGIPDNMIRLSCGIENAEDLIDDLKQALER